MDKRLYDLLWGPAANRAGKHYMTGLKYAILFVFLPIFVLSVLVMGAGEAGLVIGGFFAITSGLSILVLTPTYLVCNAVIDKRIRKDEAGGSLAGADPVRRGRAPVSVGGGHYLHADGRYRDQAGNEVPADAPRFKMLSKVGMDRMNDADLKAHLDWINRTHAGLGVYVHGDGRFSDRNWNELSPDDPRIRVLSTRPEDRAPSYLEDRVHLGGRVYLHGDGSFRDDRYRRLSPDNPKVRERLDEGKEEGG